MQYVDLVIMLRSKCFVIPKPRSNAKVRLICFPYAGGNANSFFSWANLLPDTVELVAVQMPGRAERSLELAHSDMASIIVELSGALEHFYEKPFCFFGHSLGSMVVLELSAQLQLRGARMPSHVFVSGSQPPHIPRNIKALYDLSKDDFMKELKKLNGTPKVILENIELMDYLEPLLRADFKLAETYKYTKQVLINSNVTILGGGSDVDVPQEKILQWAELFNGNSKCFMFDGGHFFIDEVRSEVITCISDVLREMSLIELNCLTRETAHT